MPGAKPPTKARTSKLLVVDASIMRAAGGEAATDPTPAHARGTLQAILNICHRVCLSPDLEEEWKRHKSKFASRWLTQMYARRKVIKCEPPPCGHIVADIRSFPSITDANIAEVEKDIHLVAAALTTQHRAILSNDNRVASLIRRVCSDTTTVTSKTIASMLWINPIADHVPLYAWLAGTGAAQPHWALGFTLPAEAAKKRSRNRSPRHP